MRGTVILAYKAFFEREHGVLAWTRIVRRMPPEHAGALEPVPVPRNWYPAQTVVSLVETAAELFPEPDLHDRLGAWHAEYDLGIVHRVLLKLASPLWIARQGGKRWSSSYNSGHWTIEAGPGPREFFGTLHEFALVRPDFCKIVAGWIRRAGQLTGGRDMRVGHPRCRCLGAPACVYHAQW